MSTSKRTIGVAGKASTLAVFALAVAACAEETPDERFDNPAADTATEDAYESPAAGTDTADPYAGEAVADNDMGSTMDRGEDAAAAAIGAEDTQQIATTLGVSDLNDLENWKITNNGEELGEIDRIGVDRATGEILAVVGLEGVVGINMKEVGIPLQRLQAAGDETLSTDLTKDELQQKRDIDPWDDSDPMDVDDAEKL